MSLKTTAAILALLLLPAGAALAQDAQGPSLKDACKAEFADVCKDSADKGGMKCLTDNKDKLSADCATAVTAAQERRKAFRAACQPDIDKLCTDKKGAEMRACLKDNAAGLSKPCADAVAAMPAQQ